MNYLNIIDLASVAGLESLGVIMALSGDVFG